MKSLIEYIIESRGIVTNENSWSDLVEYIIKNFKSDKIIITKNLPPWMNQCTVKIEDIVYGGLAEYSDRESGRIDNKMNVVINLTKKAVRYPSRLKVILEHEFQHAFDDWIARFHRGKYFLSNSYCTSIGYEGPDFDKINFWDIYDNPEKCYFDHMFYLLRESSYWFEPTESNAFLREFGLYIKNYAKTHKIWNWENLYKDPNNTGAQPLIGIMLIHKVLDEINKYDIDWEYVMRSLNDRWAKSFMGHQFPGNSKEAFCKVLLEILNNKAEKILLRYRRILKDSGLKTKNVPYWFKN